MKFLINSFARFIELTNGAGNESVSTGSKAEQRESANTGFSIYLAIDRGTDKEDEVHIYNRILLIH